MLTQVLAALADPNRQTILEILKKKDLAAGAILEHLDITGASLSHHLNVLKNANLISCRRQGQQLIYSLNLSVTEEIIKKMTKLLKHN